MTSNDQVIKLGHSGLNRLVTVISWKVDPRHTLRCRYLVHQFLLHSFPLPKNGSKKKAAYEKNSYPKLCSRYFLVKKFGLSAILHFFQDQETVENRPKNVAAVRIFVL